MGYPRDGGQPFAVTCFAWLDAAPAGGDAVDAVRQQTAPCHPRLQLPLCRWPQAEHCDSGRPRRR
eukprot:5695140-Alexandrium_andersonii.AAC.1